MNMAPITTYDVDVASDLVDLVLADPTIADSATKDKIFAFDKNDLVLVTKVFSGALKITDVAKVNPDFIAAHLK